MDRATASRIEDWDARPVAGGYAGLADLASSEFTGAVATGGTHLFMLNGRVVGVSGGSISAFEGADSTAYEAPDPALPLLFAMQEHGGEVRGQYYTDDTPLREVDETLTEGGFTGYLELSENVLSGDYYVVYYGGRSLAAAFVGNRERVVTGDEAFQLAADEVGIYEVRAVELEVTDVPEPPEDAASDSAAAGAVGGAGAAARDATDDASAEEAPVDDGAESTVEEAKAADVASSEEAESAAEAIDEAEGAPSPETPEDAGDARATTSEEDDQAESEPADAAEISSVPDEEDPETTEEPSPIADETAGEESPDVAEAEANAGPDQGDADDADREPASTASSGASSRESRPGESVDRAAPSGTGPAADAESAAGEDEPEERFREEERWREARTVPALDPEETELPTATDETETTGEATEPEPAERRRPAQRDEPGDEEVDSLRARVRELEAELESAEREGTRQAGRIEALAEERDGLVEERDALEARIEELEAELEAKEARLEAQEAEIAAGAGGTDRSGSSAGGGSTAEAIDPETALDQTDLFVRYASKGKATLQTAHDGQADRDAVSENLRLESHSRFDPGSVTVQGRPFEDYLADTIEYRFVSWLIEELIYEIQGTGNERGLRAVYDALPQIDRAEFGGTVTSLDDDGGEGRETFDVVCRDRMGKPLVVANINDSLDPATGDMMGDLVEDATATGEAHESICAAFQVTASFFEPDALETAADATGGGFLSRDSKKSFVKLSRKGGYHLCLVEARGGDFHVAVPEL